MKKVSLILFLFVLLFFQQVNAQLFKIGVGGGLLSLQSPALYKNDISLTNGNVDAYGLNNNYHFGVEAKFNLPLFPITPVAFIDYHVFRGSGSGDYTGFQTSLNMITIGAEAEYYFLPLPFLRPYLSVNISENSFGKLEIQAPGGATLDSPSYSRIGGGAGIGAEVTITPVNFDLYSQYNSYNLVGKNSGEQSVNAVSVNLMLLF
ncbi:MAG: outer membrane beta-barrel protein [Ignavibacteriaceae bacterium]